MQQQPSSRTCFLCGQENPISLKLVWFNDDEAQKVRADLTVSEYYNGYPGVVHGGVVAAILDETAGRALMLDGNMDELTVTSKMEVKYRKPTPTNVPLEAVGWIIRRDKSRAWVGAEIRLADGTVTAKCKATVIKTPPGIIETWEQEKVYWKVYPND